MKKILPLFIAISLIAFAGCSSPSSPDSQSSKTSGMTVSRLGKGKNIEPKQLAQQQIENYNTIRYHGSDRLFHHFSHQMKTVTSYKIPRDKMKWAGEFSITENRSVIAGEKLMRLLKEYENSTE